MYYLVCARRPSRLCLIGGLWFGAPYYYFGWLNEPVGNFLASFPEFVRRCR